MNWLVNLSESPQYTNPNRVNDINLLYPPFRIKVELLLEQLRMKGFKPVVYETFRSAKRVDDYIKRGVKAIRGSMHCFGCACDIYFANDKGSLFCADWNTPEQKALWDEAHKLGLYTVSGDGPHLQFVSPKGPWQGKIRKGQFP